MSGFNKGLIGKALVSTNFNQGNTWGPINIHIKFKQLVPSRRCQRSRTIGSISTIRQMDRTLDIMRNRIMSCNSSIWGILKRLSYVCMFEVWLHKFGFCTGKLFCIWFGCRFDFVRVSTPLLQLELVCCATVCPLVPSRAPTRTRTIHEVAICAVLIEQKKLITF